MRAFLDWSNDRAVSCEPIIKAPSRISGS